MSKLQNPLATIPSRTATSWPAGTRRSARSWAPITRRCSGSSRPSWRAVAVGSSRAWPRRWSNNRGTRPSSDRPQILFSSL